VTRRPSGGVAAPWSRRQGEDGAALVASLLLASVLVAVALMGGVVADLIAARQRAAAAADLGALAGAPAAQTSEIDACAAAAWVVRENGATLRGCEVVDGDVRLTASARPRAAWSRWFAGLFAGAVEPVVSAHAGLR
jgi:secretion/DNA translocation related TadE-like protein